MLTVKAIDAALPCPKLYRLFDGQGLYLEIKPTGKKYWRFKYQFAKKEKRIALGVYPNISLADARKARESYREMVRINVDPSLVKHEQRTALVLTTNTTFELVAREWHELNRDRWSKNHAEDLLHRLDKDIFEHIGSIPIALIKPLHILGALRIMEKRGANELAKRALQYCGQVFRYAVITERAPADPTVFLRGALRPVKKGHFAAINSDELPAFIKCLQEDVRMYEQTRAAMWFLLMTFVRTGELIGATWNEIDLERAEWKIPAARMKMKREHLVPLSKQAVALLSKQKERTGKWQYVFPCVSSLTKHMSNNTLLKAIKSMGYEGRMTGHGARALAMSTIKEKLGYRHEVIDRQLAHAPANKIIAAYDRAAFLEERKVMMQEWSDYLDRHKK